MQTRRDYAASLGLAKAGARGKFSTAAKEAIAKAEAEGVTFADTGKVTVVKPRKVKPSGDSKATVQTTGDSTGIVDLAPYRYNEDSHVCREVKSGVVRSLRSACNGCGVSLVVCWCPNPRIVALDGSGSVNVKIDRA